MCGRFSCIPAKEGEIYDRFGLKPANIPIKPRFNISPSQKVLVVLNESPDTLSLAHWGLIPFWADDPKIGYRMINARAETLAVKPAFRQPVRKKRCLIIADSFYEWKKELPRKRPFRIMLKNGGLFAFAGIWDRWEKGKEPIESCSIITTEANTLVARIHDRMPVILPRQAEREWLASTDLNKALGMLKSYDPAALKAYEISTDINSPANDDPEVIRPLK